jgi:hypothetical protein
MEVGRFYSRAMSGCSVVFGKRQFLNICLMNLLEEDAMLFSYPYIPLSSQPPHHNIHISLTPYTQEIRTRRPKSTSNNVFSRPCHGLSKNPYPCRKQNPHICLNQQCRKTSNSIATSLFLLQQASSPFKLRDFASAPRSQPFDLSSM